MSTGARRRDVPAQSRRLCEPWTQSNLKQMWCKPEGCFVCAHIKRGYLVNGPVYEQPEKSGSALCPLCKQMGFLYFLGYQDSTKKLLNKKNKKIFLLYKQGPWHRV